MTAPKYPQVQVSVPENGSTFVLCSRTRAALKRAGVSDAECTEFFEQATSDGHGQAVQTLREWVTVK